MKELLSKEMKRKRYPSLLNMILIIVTLFCVAIISIFVFVEIKYEGSQILKTFSSLIGIITDICVSFIMSFIFYLVVFIPERRKEVSIQRHIGYYIRYLQDATGVLIGIISRYEQEPSDQKLIRCSPHLKTTIEPMTGERRPLTYRDHFVESYHTFSELFDELNSYVIFLDNKQRDTLIEIEHSEFLQNVRKLLIDNPTPDKDKAFMKYYSADAISNVKNQLLLWKDKLA